MLQRIPWLRQVREEPPTRFINLRRALENAIFSSTSSEEASGAFQVHIMEKVNGLLGEHFLANDKL
jgi:hypothetical protein